MQVVLVNVMAKKSIHDLRVVTWQDPAYEGRRDKISACFILGDITTIHLGDKVHIRFGKKNAKVWSGTYEGTVDEVEIAALAPAIGAFSTVNAKHSVLSKPI